MNIEKNKLWEDLAHRALNRAVEKINKVSVFKWRYDNDANIAKDYEAVCSYFEVLDSENSMSFAMLFNREDIKAISKSFIGYGFFVSQKMTKAEELLIEELSNIILNAMISEISNAVKRKIIPSGPKTVQALRNLAMDIISSNLPQNANKIGFLNSISIKCGDSYIVCEIYSFVSRNIVREISAQ